MLRQTIFDQIKQAMKAHQTDKLGVLRFIYSEIKNVEIDAKHELTDNEVIGLLRKEVKRRKEAIDQYRAGGRDDIVSKELAELTIIETFLPAQMSVETIEKIVTDIVAQNQTHDFGQLMKLVMAATQGQADGKLVSQIVRSKLS
jgi:uncharacterized protein YqeY